MRYKSKGWRNADAIERSCDGRFVIHVKLAMITVMTCVMQRSGRQIQGSLPSSPK